MSGHATRVAFPGATRRMPEELSARRAVLLPASRCSCHCNMVLGREREDRRGAMARLSSVSPCLTVYQQGFPKKRPCTRRGADPLDPVRRSVRTAERRIADCAAKMLLSLIGKSLPPSCSRAEQQARPRQASEPNRTALTAPHYSSKRLTSLSASRGPVERFSSDWRRALSIAPHGLRDLDRPLRFSRSPRASGRTRAARSSQ